MKCFSSINEYLDELRRNPELSIISQQMAADALGVSSAAIARQLKLGQLEALKIGRARHVIASSVIDKLDEWETEVETVRGFLEEIAELGACTNYGPVMAKIDRSTTVPNDRGIIGKILGQISEETFEAHGFMLSALVIKSGTDRPSPSFFGLAEQIDETYSNYNTDMDYLQEQLRRIHQHYS